MKIGQFDTVTVGAAPGFQRRIGRLLDPADEFAVIVAIDHGLAGWVDGLRDPAAALTRVMAEQPNGIILNAGLARRVISFFCDRSSPALIIGIDQVVHAGPRGSGPAVAHFPQRYVSEAALMGADAVKAMLLMGHPDRSAQADNLSYLGRMAMACQRWQVPFIVEPYLCGPDVQPSGSQRSEMNADGARMAVEIGADLLKLEYPGDPTVFHDIVSSMPVPVVVLGGPRRPSRRAVLHDIAAAARAGAVGVAMGRNIWGQDDPAAMIRAIRDAARSSGSGGPRARADASTLASPSSGEMLGATVGTE